MAKGIHIEGLSKRYGTGDTAVDALKDVNMSVAPGEVVGLVGPSGSGKSTLLKCLGAVIEPTRGRMTLGGDVIYEQGWKIPDLRSLRRDRIGFVFQAPYLIPFLDVTDNVALLPMLAGQPNAVARQRAAEQRGRIGPDAIESSDLSRERQQQERFADPARSSDQSGLRLGEHAFDQPAALLGLPDETICRPPAGDVQRRDGGGDSDRL